MEKLILNFHSDSGHGWIKVNKQSLIDLGIDREISEYSYMKNNFVFLEEDCDALIYINKLREKNIEFKFNEINDGDQSPIRNFKRYEA